MADGDLITEPFQFEFNGVLFGDNSNFDIQSVTGLDMTSVREGDSKRPLDHGSLDLVPDLLPHRIVVVRMNAQTDDQDVLEELRAATRLREAQDTQLLPLVFMDRSLTKKRLMARVRRRDVPWDVDFALGYGNISLMFWAPDPRIYSNDTVSDSIELFSDEGLGFDFDVEFDLSFGGATTGDIAATLTNVGDISVGMVAVIHGPINSPVLINQTTGESWRSTLDLPSGLDLTVDFAEQTVVITGGGSRFSTVPASAVWWRLIPGDNVVQLSAASGSGTADLSFRSAWHAAV